MASRVIEIGDPESGSSAKVLVSLGFNCFSWRPVLADGPREMLWAHPAFAGGGERPSGSGIPLLFPFPGRIGGAKFSFGGRQFQLEPADAFGNAIHGFVYTRPWRVIEQTAARVVGEFQASVDDPSVLARWPSDFRIRVAYEVRGRELVSDVRYENTGDGPLPCGFGTHAYFHLPLAEGSDAEATLVRVPTSAVWEARDMLPTGRTLPVPDELDLASGGPLAGRKFDTYFTRLAADGDGQVRTSLTEPRTGRTVTQSFAATFPHCVVYTPPHREAICLEPYSCIADSFRLEDAGVATGREVLAPGEARETRILIVVSG